MPRKLRLLTVAGIALAAINMADDGCGDEWDQGEECDRACEHLVACENEWLDDEGKTPMGDYTDEPVYDTDYYDTDYYDTDGSSGPSMNATELEYFNECHADCLRSGDKEEIGCVQDSTCSELLDGECSD
jgi:hypothetical protein